MAKQENPKKGSQSGCRLDYNNVIHEYFVHKTAIPPNVQL